jgi:16S rRNA G966 N2-methylase RsmD
VVLGRNTLFYGDNLDILRHHIPSESVDLIYLDPPFNKRVTLCSSGAEPRLHVIAA